MLFLFPLSWIKCENMFVFFQFPSTVYCLGTLQSIVLYCFNHYRSLHTGLQNVRSKNNVQALSKKDARAIRKFSGMLKRMHMHTMP